LIKVTYSPWLRIKTAQSDLAGFALLGGEKYHAKRKVKFVRLLDGFYERLGSAQFGIGAS